MQKIIILDFGSQTTQLIGRRVRELDTFCEILPYNKFPYDDPSIIGVILSGSPFSVYDEKAFKLDLMPIIDRYPVLGICYGAQLMAQTFGGSVKPAGTREYGRANLQWIEKENPLFKDFVDNSQVWMSHGDTIVNIPPSFHKIASTDSVQFAAYQWTGKQVWGVQFHPEVFHSLQGTQLLHNFVVDICGSQQDWSSASFVEATVSELKQQIGNDQILTIQLADDIAHKLLVQFFRNALLSHQRFGKHLHGGDRRLQLMRDIGHKFLAGFFQLVDPVQHHVKGIGDRFDLTASGQVDPFCSTALSDMLNGLFDLPERFDHPVRSKERKPQQHHDQNDHDCRHDQTD